MTLLKKKEEEEAEKAEEGVVEEMGAKVLGLDDVVKIIQVNERARQGRQRARVMKEIR
jgi:hypothetical protein